MNNIYAHKVLNEDVEGKSQNYARHLYIKTYLEHNKIGIDDLTEDELLNLNKKAKKYIDSVRNKIRYLKNNNNINGKVYSCGKFTLGCVRLVLDGGVDADYTLLNNIIFLLGKTPELFNKYNKNLGLEEKGPEHGLSMMELLNQLKDYLARDKEFRKKEKEEAKKRIYSRSYHNNGYKIIHIKNYNQINKYGNYFMDNYRWCVINSYSSWNDYTRNGLFNFYLCKRKDAKPTDRADDTNLDPMDNYGTSMLGVIVDDNGELYACTSRWNDGGACFTEEDISNIVGVNFYETFKPNNEFKIKVDNAINNYINTGDINSSFDSSEKLKNGIYLISLNGLFNYMSVDGKLLSPERWFESCSRFFENGFAEVIYDKKLYLFDQNTGEICTHDEKFKKDLENFNNSGNIDDSFKMHGEFIDGVAVVRGSNNKYNYLTINKEFLLNEWVEFADNFSDGYGLLKDKGKYNFINKDKKFISNTWFNSATSFHNNYALVHINNMGYNLLRVNGTYVSNRWFENGKVYKSENLFNRGNETYIAHFFNDDETENYYVDYNENFLTERPKNNIKENILIENMLLNEDIESKSQGRARDLYIDGYIKSKNLDKNKLSKEEKEKIYKKADNYVNYVRLKIGSLRKKNYVKDQKANFNGKFILGCTRILINEEMSNHDVFILDKIIGIIGKNEKLYNTFNKNLGFESNGPEHSLSFRELEKMFLPQIIESNKVMKEKINSQKYKRNSNYNIVKVNSFRKAGDYYYYGNKSKLPKSSWCITYDNIYWDENTNNGANQVYFCYRNDITTNDEPIVGKNHPADEYGLSAFFVIVNANGELEKCTSRWNHIGDGNDNVMNELEISNLLGVNFYKVFKPNNKTKNKINFIQRSIQNGVRMELINGINATKLSNGNYLVYFLGSDVFKILRPDGSQINDVAFEHYIPIDCLEHEILVIEKNGQYNFINSNGELLMNEWAEEFKTDGRINPLDGFIFINGKYYFYYLDDQIDPMGGIYFPFSDGFDKVIDFYDKSAEVYIKEKGYCMLDLEDMSYASEWSKKPFNNNNGFNKVFETTNYIINKYLKNLDETTTASSVGEIQYDVPVFGDKETLSRGNGFGGSTSINHIKNNKKKKLIKNGN